MICFSIFINLVYSFCIHFLSQYIFFVAGLPNDSLKHGEFSGNTLLPYGSPLKCRLALFMPQSQPSTASQKMFFEHATLTNAFDSSISSKL